MPNVEAPELALIRSILAAHVPSAEVRAFGSRVRGIPKPYSDLDLLVHDAHPLSLRTKGELIEAFQESDLPFRVDVVDWHRATETFRSLILEDSEIVQEGKL